MSHEVKNARDTRVRNYRESGNTVTPPIPTPSPGTARDVENK